MKPGWLEGELQDSSSSPSDDDANDDENDDQPCYFYRIEFQARGALHVHMLCWCKDSSGQPYPNLMNTKDHDIPQKLLEIAACHSKLIKTEIDDDLDQTLKEMVERYQTHCCTFRCDCQKKKRYFLGIFPKWRAPPPPPLLGISKKFYRFFWSS